MIETDPAALMIQLIDEIKRGHGRMVTLSRRFVAEGEPDGLARAVLTAVVLAPRPPTVPQIGRSLGYPRQTIQRQAQLLADAGLILFVDTPDHKRARRLVPTDAARAMHEASARRSREWAAQFTRDLDIDALTTAVRALRAVREKLEAEARLDQREYGEE